MTLEDNKLEILRRVEQGTLSLEEGAHLLEILDGGVGQPDPVPSAQVKEAPSETPREVPAGWRAVWSIFLWLGIIFMGLSGYWLFGSYERSGMGVGFWFALSFLIISCATVWAGWELLASRWIVVRVHSREKDGNKNFSIWAPLPLQLASWVFNTFGRYMPYRVQEKHFETVIQEMTQSLGPNEPFVVDVDGEQDGKAHINVEFS